MGPLQSVDGDGNFTDPRRNSTAHPLIRHLPRTGDDAAQHAAAVDLRGDPVPIVAQVELAADERDLLDPEIGQLVHEIERLRRAQFVLPHAARARAAMAAAQVATNVISQTAMLGGLS